MYQIAANEIDAVNGLAGENTAENWQIVQDMITTSANAFATVNDSLNNNSSNQQQGSSTIVGGNPSTYSPNVRPLTTTSKKEETNYLPWIIGGVGVVLLLSMLVMSNNKKR